MALRIYMFLLAGIFFTSTLSMGLLFFYMNPESNLQIAFSLLALAVFLSGMSSGAFFIFFFKKIYYRGEAYIDAMHRSVRQSSLIVFAILACIGLYAYDIFHFRLVALIWATVICFEVMLQTLD